jgi:poly(hydroxyalkanoate) depolymerase family esterase
VTPSVKRLVYNPIMRHIVDWRELYAANQAVIQGNLAAPSPASEAKFPRTKPTGRDGARRAGGDHALGTGPGGAGKWERFTYAGTHGSGPYFLYTPAGLDPRAGSPLLVMLHGCTQTPVDLARGTRMNEVADRHGFVVAYPEQTNRRNQQGCWNWFLAHHQARESGEPALLAGITQEATARLGASGDPERVFLAGMSAGAAMAVVMGATHPDLFAAIGIHSGLAYGAATSQRTAFEAMARGARDPAHRGSEAFQVMRERARLMPTIVLHGTRDSVVRPVNGDQVVQQWLATNALATAGSFNADPARPDDVDHGRVEHGHPFSRYRWNDSRGGIVQEYVKIEGLGHAWSGGNETGSYTDARGPDASEAIWQFFAQLSQP